MFYKPLELVDVPALVAACTDRWYHQKGCTPVLIPRLQRFVDNFHPYPGPLAQPLALRTFGADAATDLFDESRY